jgi:hypothetical protein
MPYENNYAARSAAVPVDLYLLLSDFALKFSLSPSEIP